MQLINSTCAINKLHELRKNSLLVGQSESSILCGHDIIDVSTVF